jgi:hypothetical protein
MSLLGIVRATREAPQLRLGVALTHVLEHCGDQGLVAEVLVADVTEDADPHGRFWASAMSV